MHTPGPWKAVDRVGAGWQIDGTLPAGFKFDGTAHSCADGTTGFMLWTIRRELHVQVADERWVQFETGPWTEMQAANARLIAASPQMYDALNLFLRKGFCSEVIQACQAAISQATGPDAAQETETDHA